MGLKCFYTGVRMNSIQDYFQVMVKISRSARVFGYYTVFTGYVALEFKLRKSRSEITNKLLPRINAALAQTNAAFIWGL